MRSKTIGALAALTAGVLLLPACGSRNDDGGGTDTGSVADVAAIQEAMPDVNGDGNVVIGIMSPGDTGDGGYYESFVTEARAIADEKGWTLNIVDKINTSDAVAQARNLCRQNVDMIAVGASELKDALSATSDESCANVAFYISSGDGVEENPQVAQSQDRANESIIAAGYSAGLIMQRTGAKTAGFIGGPEVDFSTRAANAYAAGVKQVVPDANVLTTYTGDSEDSGKAREAATAQMAQGAAVIYPYLGGATDSVASLANERNVAVLTPGSDRCGTGTPTYDVSVLFAPGLYFGETLNQFNDGALELGAIKVYHLGVDKYPTVKICEPQGTEEAQLNEFIAGIGAGDIKPDDLIAASVS